MKDSGHPGSASLLESIVKHPGLCWGNSDNDFQCFQAFLAGAGIAMSLRSQVIQDEPANMVPPHFMAFVFEELGVPKNSRLNWFSAIEAHTKDGREALDRLYELRKKYDQSKWAQMKAKDS